MFVAVYPSGQDGGMSASPARSCCGRSISAWSVWGLRCWRGATRDRSAIGWAPWRTNRTPVVRCRMQGLQQRKAVR